MRRNGGSQIGFELIAIALLAIAFLGAVTMQAAVAEDAGWNGAGGNRAGFHETKTKATVALGARVHRRPLSPSRASGHTVRNAIGVVVPDHKNVERPDAQRPQSVAVPHSPALPGSVSKVPAHFATTGEPNGHPAYHPNGVIGGPSGRTMGATGPMHRSSGVSGIGGPASAAAGISGTSIRPKY